MRVHSARERRGGFTLIEVLLSVAILGSLLGTVFLVQRQGERAAHSGNAQLQANLKAARVVDRVVRELQGMGGDGATPSQATALGTDTLTFQVSEGVDAGAVDWSTPRRLELQMAPGEADNGLDDDLDGLIDERALVLTLDLGSGDQRSTILCAELRELFPGETENALDDDGNGVADERGFNLHRTGDVLEVRVCVEQPGPEGSLVTASVETSFRVRN